MLSLTESLVDKLNYHGKTYQLDLAFDTVLKFYELLDDDNLEDSEKISVAFEIFMGFTPDDVDFAIAVFQKINQYIAKQPYGDEEESNVDGNGQAMTPQKYYSFTQDAEAIYASFREQYGINLLQEKGKLHWDEFKALFAGLGPNTYFQRIVEIRMRDTSKLEGQALNDTLKAQQYYELNENKTEKAREQQFTGFMNTLKAWAQS